jgi:uncharacterized repeat protein (TIGR02543 family)
MKNIILVVLLIALPAIAPAQYYTIKLSKGNVDNLFSQIWDQEKVIVQKQILALLNNPKYGFSQTGADYYPGGTDTQYPYLNLSAGSDGQSVNIAMPATILYHVHLLAPYIPVLVSADIQASCSGKITYDNVNSRLTAAVSASVSATNLNAWASLAQDFLASWSILTNSTMPSTDLNFSFGKLQFDIPKSVDAYGVALSGLTYDGIGQSIVLQLNSTIPSLTVNRTGQGTTSPIPGTYYGSASYSITALPNTGYSFNSWSGAATGTTNPVTIAMAGNKTLTAQFGNVNISSHEIQFEEIPTEFALQQNYPNPFNPTTTIRYAIPTDSHVTLLVFNALGQEISELVNNEKSAGFYDVTFDAAGLASGVYFYRIQAGNFVQTRKLMVVK